MVKRNGVKISKGRKRKLIGTKNTAFTRDRFYPHAKIIAYRWREL